MFRLFILFVCFISTFSTVESSMRRYFVKQSSKWMKNCYKIINGRIFEKPFQVIKPKEEAYEVFLQDHIVKFPTKKEFDKSLKTIVHGEYFAEKTKLTDVLNQRLTLMEVLEKLEKACDDFYSYRTQNCTNEQRLALEMMIIERKKDQILNALLQNDPIAQEQFKKS